MKKLASFPVPCEGALGTMAQDHPSPVASRDGLFGAAERLYRPSRPRPFPTETIFKGEFTAQGSVAGRLRSLPPRIAGEGWPVLPHSAIPNSLRQKDIRL